MNSVIRIHKEEFHALKTMESLHMFTFHRDWKWDKSGAKLTESHLKSEKKSIFIFLLHTF